MRQFFYEDNQFIVFETKAECEVGTNYKLSADSYIGELADDLDGLYRSEYDTADGQHV